MDLMKTDKDVLTNDDILNFIAKYESHVVPHLNKLWDYYEGENTAILKRRTPDPNNPDNRIVVAYGRKIVTTFTGYAYRPRYISYKANVEQMFDEEGSVLDQEAPVEEEFMREIQQVFDRNNEHIKTSHAGRNTAIFGVAYELCYIDSSFTTEAGMPFKAEPRFFSVDPREMIVLYNYDPEPKIHIGIRFYKMDTPNKYKVEVYYKTRTVVYERTRNDNSDKWELFLKGEYPNYYPDAPVVAYYIGDDVRSIISPVLSLIDAYDVLFSDSMNEFDRFAFAYLVMKKFGLTDAITKKDPTKLDNVLKFIKRRRVFENLPADADIKFLTKDIPTTFIQYMAQTLKEQIHIQSHVPDFTSPQMAAGTSGIAIQRLMFDFENLVSSAEADFDVGLLRRIELIAGILNRLGRVDGSTDMVMISHKRNMPTNLMEFAQTAATMKQAGFSSYLCADIFPDDVIPNVEEELERQKAEQEALMGANNFGFNPNMELDGNGNPIDPIMTDQNTDEGV